jgi:hypothetical protein
VVKAASASSLKTPTDQPQSARSATASVTVPQLEDAQAAARSDAGRFGYPSLFRISDSEKTDIKRSNITLKAARRHLLRKWVPTHAKMPDVGFTDVKKIQPKYRP